MRIDKFLNVVNLVKRRSIAQDMCENGAIFIGDKSVKSSKEVKVGDIIKVVRLENIRCFEVVAIPEQKTIPKSKSMDYIKEL